MVQGGEHPRLALEAREPIRIARHRARQDLDRDVAPELGIASPIHLTHAASAEQRLQAISAQRVAAHGGRREPSRTIWLWRRGRSKESVARLRYVQRAA